MNYGVQPIGFNRKPMSVILSELEAAMIAEFGPDVVQTAQSPLGQLNGLMTEAIALTWEIAENTYQSFDIDQAEQLRLNTTAKLRRLERLPGETDGAFRLRISNEAQADIKLVANIQRLSALDGVTWVSARENATSEVSALGMPPHSVAYAVLGGDDGEVGYAVYQLSVPGVEMVGNYLVNIVADDYCQQALYIRPEIVPVRVAIDVKALPDPSGCAPPNIGTIADAFIAASAKAYRNGDTVTVAQQEARLGALGLNLDIVDIRIARASDVIEAESLPTTIFELPVIVAPYVEVRYV